MFGVSNWHNPFLKRFTFAQANKESGCFMESIGKYGKLVVNISDECMFAWSDVSFATTMKKSCIQFWSYLKVFSKWDRLASWASQY